jgi:antitoxin component YwqK of YwqJK toxin-antitoxin module
MKVLFTIILSVFFLASFSQEPYTIKYSTGEILERGHLNDQGFPEGEITRYFKNGKISGVAYYSNGKKCGDWFIYNQKGLVETHLVYVNGELKKAVQWSEHGILASSY